MASDKVQMPSSGGGLVRYFDDYKSKIEISPIVIIVIIALIAVVEIMLHKGWFL